MKNLICENLNENEFDELISVLPREILITPFISNPKRFSEYFKGFRPAHIPEFKIKAAYKKLVFRKEDQKLTDYTYDNIEEYVKKHIDEHIGSELLDRLRGLNYTDSDLSRLIDIFYENQIKLNISLYLKIHGINLPEKSIDFINAEIVEKIKWKEITNKVESNLEKKYIDVLKKKDNETKNLIKQAEAKVEAKYNRIIEEVYSKTQNMIDVAVKETEAIKREYLECIEKNERLDKVVDDLRIIIKQHEDIIGNYKNNAKRAEKVIEDKDKQIIELSDKLIKLQSIKMADLIDKETISDIITSASKLEGKEKMREYYESYKNDTEDGYIKDIWYKWISNEKLIIDAFLDIVISEKKLTAFEVEKLDDIVYSLNLRIILIKMLESIAYKYLSIQKYNEAFE